MYIKKRLNKIRWSKEEDKKLKKIWPSGSINEIMKSFPGRSHRAIAHRAARFNIRSRVWRRSDETRPDWIFVQFDNLIIIKEVKSNKLGRRFLCYCICGGKPIIRELSYLLRITATLRSCGCVLKKSSIMTPRDASINGLMTRYKLSLKQKSNKKLKWMLSRNEFVKLIFDNCFYCDKEPFNSFNRYATKNGKKLDTYVKNIETINNATIYYNGIDRIDSNKTYVINNVVSCCSTCNYAKRNLNVNEFIEWINGIAQNIEKLNNNFNTIKTKGKL